MVSDRKQSMFSPNGHRIALGVLLITTFRRNYLVSITMTGPHAVNRMLPTAYGTV